MWTREVLVFLSSLSVLLFSATAGAASVQDYLLVSQPQDRTISYIKLSVGDELSSSSSGMFGLFGGGSSTSEFLGVDTPVLRPLLNSDLQAPSDVAVDSQRLRLFVADPSAQRVVWYQLQVLPDGRLLTDGLQRVAVGGVSECSDLAVSEEGDLYFGAKLNLAPPAVMAEKGIFRLTADDIGDGKIYSPELLWDTGYSDGKASGVGALDVDPVHIYWGNGRNGLNHGSVIRGPTRPAHLGADVSRNKRHLAVKKSLEFGSGAGALSDNSFLQQEGSAADQVARSAAAAAVAAAAAGGVHKQPAALIGVSSALSALANNTDSVVGVANSARFVFYSSNTGVVYAVDKGKMGQGCGRTPNGRQCIWARLEYVLLAQKVFAQNTPSITET